MIRRQKWNVILGMLWLAHYNLEINWRTKKVKMTRCLEKCGKQWRSKQGKSGWKKQKKEEKKEERGKETKRERTKKEEKEKTKKRKNNGSKEDSRRVRDLG